MKNLFVKLHLLSLCLITLSINAQQETNDPVAEYFSKVKPHLYAAAKEAPDAKDIREHNNALVRNLGVYINGMDLEEVLNYTRLRLKAMNADPIGFTKILNKDVYLHFQKKNTELLDRASYTHFEMACETKLREHYSDEMIGSISVPLVLHIRAASLRDSAAYEEVMPGRKHKKEFVIVKADILEAFKGEGIKKNGNSLQFYYMKDWMENGKSFEAGKEYLVFLDILFSELEENKYDIRLMTYAKNDGIFPIEDGMLINESDYFKELSGRYSLNEFKTLLKEKIIGAIR